MRVFNRLAILKRSEFVDIRVMLLLLPVSLSSRKPEVVIKQLFITSSDVTLVDSVRPETLSSRDSVLSQLTVSVLVTSPEMDAVSQPELLRMSSICCRLLSCSFRYFFSSRCLSLLSNSSGGIGVPLHVRGRTLCAGRPGLLRVCSFLRHLARRFWNQTCRHDEKKNYSCNWQKTSGNVFMIRFLSRTR